MVYSRLHKMRNTAKSPAALCANIAQTASGPLLAKQRYDSACSLLSSIGRPDPRMCCCVPSSSPPAFNRGSCRERVQGTLELWLSRTTIRCAFLCLHCCNPIHWLSIKTLAWCASSSRSAISHISFTTATAGSSQLSAHTAQHSLPHSVSQPDYLTALGAAAQAVPSRARCASLCLYCCEPSSCPLAVEDDLGLPCHEVAQIGFTQHIDHICN